jgi:hypothetical protein
MVLKECEVYNQDKKEIMDYIYRFTFLSEMQYLNNKEQIFNEIYVKGDDVIDINLEGLNILEGSSKDINYKDVDYSYSLAKNFLRHKTKNSVEKLSAKLKDKLEKEISRIMVLYNSQEEEIKEKIEKLKNNLENALKEKDKKKASKIEIEINEFSEKLNDRVRIAERDFFIQDEKSKHSINIKNKLINSTIIYYPNYKFNIYIKNKKSMRSLQINFEPFADKFSKLYCDSCKKELSEIYLCSSGHISCKDCSKDRCKECDLIICKSCIKKNCFICNKKLCRKCDKQCTVCLNIICGNDGLIQESSGKMICNNCGRRCCRCNKWFDNKKLKLFGPKKICEACLRIENIHKSNV